MVLQKIKKYLVFKHLLKIILVHQFLVPANELLKFSNHMFLLKVIVFRQDPNFATDSICVDVFFRSQG